MEEEVEEDGWWPNTRICAQRDQFWGQVCDQVGKGDSHPVDPSRRLQQTPFKAINLLLAAFFSLSLSFLLPRVDNGDSLRAIVATAAGVRLGPAGRHSCSGGGDGDGETPFGASKKSYAADSLTD